MPHFNIKCTNHVHGIKTLAHELAMLNDVAEALLTQILCCPKSHFSFITNDELFSKSIFNEHHSTVKIHSTVCVFVCTGH